MPGGSSDDSETDVFISLSPKVILNYSVWVLQYLWTFHCSLQMETVLRKKLFKFLTFAGNLPKWINFRGHWFNKKWNYFITVTSKLVPVLFRLWTFSLLPIEGSSYNATSRGALRICTEKVFSLHSCTVGLYLEKYLEICVVTKNRCRMSKGSNIAKSFVRSIRDQFEVKFLR